MADGSITLKTNIDMSGIASGVQKIEKEFKTLNSSITKSLSAFKEFENILNGLNFSAMSNMATDVAETSTNFLTLSSQLATVVEQLKQAQEYATGFKSSVENVSASSLSSSINAPSTQFTPNWSFFENGETVQQATNVENMLQQIATTLNNIGSIIVALNNNVDTASNSTLDMLNSLNSYSNSASYQLEDVVSTAGEINDNLLSASEGAVKFGNKSAEAGSKAVSSFNSALGVIKKLAVQLGLAFSIRQFIQFSNEAGELATTTEASVGRVKSIFGEYATTVGDFIDNNTEALGWSKALATETASVYGNLLNVWADNETNANLTNEMMKQTAVVASKTGRTVEDVTERIRSGLLGNTEAIEDLGINVNIKTIEITDAFKRIADGRSWEQLNAYEQAQVRTLAILEQSYDKFGDSVANTTALTRTKFQAAYEDFKNTWGKFVNVVLMPVLEVLTEILKKITLLMNIIGGFRDKTIEVSENSTSGLEDLADAQAGVTDEINNSAEAQERFLAGFDKVQKIETGGSGSDSGTGTGSSADLSVTTTGGTDELSNQVSTIDTALGLIMEVAGLSLIAIGLILCSTGHLGWGIAFIIAGALAFVSGEVAIMNSDVGDKTANMIGAIMTALGGALVAIGMLLIYLGQFAWGVGFIIVGATLFGVGAVSIANGSDLSEKIKSMLTGILAVAGGVLLAIGLILVFTGHITPISIALILSGAVALVSATTISEGVANEKVLTALTAISAIAGGFLLVLGIILLITGAGIPLGLGMILAGATGLAVGVAANWDFITEKLQSVWEGISSFWESTIKPGIDTVIAVIKSIWEETIQPVLQYVIDGVQDLWDNYIQPLWVDHLKPAIDEISSALQGLWNDVIEPVANWIGDKIGWLWDKILEPLVNLIKDIFVTNFKNSFDTIKSYLEIFFDFVGGIIDSIKDVFSGIINFITGVFTGDFDKAIDGISQTFDGLMGGIKTVFSTIANSVITVINGFIKGINLMIDVINAIPGVDISKIPEIPKLAQGAVIPPNKEFLAVLGDQKSGTNIEAPLSTIKQAVAEVLASASVGGSSDTINLVLELDGDVIYKSVVNKNKQNSIRTGKNALAY